MTIVAILVAVALAFIVLRSVMGIAKFVLIAAIIVVAGYFLTSGGLHL